MRVLAPAPAGDEAERAAEWLRHEKPRGKEKGKRKKEKERKKSKG
jgi:hypothetical protein